MKYLLIMLCLASLLSARNPFAPTPEALIKAKIKLKLIYTAKNQRIALLAISGEQKYVKKSDKVGTLSVTDIENDYIVLQNSSLSVKIYIGD